MFKFYLNSTEVTQGISNWEDMQINVIRDATNRIVRLDMPQEMTLTGEAYKIIHDVFVDTGYCSEVAVRIDKEDSNNSIGYNTFFNGLIFINECEFDTFNSMVVVPIRDNSFISRINSNKLIEFNVGSDTTKNSEDMTAATTEFLTMFNQTTGTNNGGFTNSGDRAGYDWFDVLQKIVLFLSDNEISVVSDWYTNLDNEDKLMLIRGYELRNADAQFYKYFINFKDLTEDVFLTFNLWMTIDGDTLRIEPESYYFNTDTLFTFDKIKDVKQTFSEQKFYSNVKFGSVQSTDTGAFPIIRFLSFQKEDYYLGGKCNIQNTLNLEYNYFITDANVIEDVLLNNNDAYDEDVFIVQYDSSTNRATDNSLPPLTGHYYNVLLANISIAERYDLNSSMFSVLNSLEDRFRATATVDGEYNGFNYGWQTNIFTYDVDPLPAYQFNPMVSWLDDTNTPNFNSNSRLNTATNTYTANTTGYYNFYVKIKLSLNIQDKTDTDGLRLYQRFVISGASDQIVLLKQVGTGIENLPATGDYEVEGYLNDVFLVAGDTVIIGIADYGQNTTRTISSYCFFDIRFNSGSIGECLTTPISGGEYNPANPDVFKASLFSFEKKMTQTEVNSLLDTPYKAFKFNQDGVNNKKVWANEISISLKDNNATIEAISDLENSK